MSLNHQNILQTKVTIDSKEIILEEIKKYLVSAGKKSISGGKKAQKSLVISTPNPEQIVLAQLHPQFMDMLNRADVALPDGIGLLWASRVTSYIQPEGSSGGIHARISGVDFMQDLVALSADRGVRIGLIGGFDGLAVKALECLKLRHPKLNGWASDVPDLTGDTAEHMEWQEDSYWEHLSQKISSTETGILFVGLGAPKQEYVIDRLRVLCSSVVLMSVGGAFDIITGRLKRAPLFIRSIGFEWAWRLLLEPWRFNRQRALVSFIWLVLYEKLFQSVSKRG